LSGSAIYKAGRDERGRGQVEAIGEESAEGVSQKDVGIIHIDHDPEAIGQHKNLYEQQGYQGDSETAQPRTCPD
jgi:hypothetical protein